MKPLSNPTDIWDELWKDRLSLPAVEHGGPVPVRPANIQGERAWDFVEQTGTYLSPVNTSEGLVWPDDAEGDRIEALLTEPLGNLFEPFVEQGTRRWTPHGSEELRDDFFQWWWHYLEHDGVPYQSVGADTSREVAVVMQGRAEQRAEAITQELEALFAYVAGTLKPVVAMVETGAGLQAGASFDSTVWLRRFRAEVKFLWKALQRGASAGRVLFLFDMLAARWELATEPWLGQRSLVAWQLHLRDGHLNKLRDLVQDWVSYEITASGAKMPPQRSEPEEGSGRKPNRMSEDTKKVLFVARRVFGEGEPEDWSISEMIDALRSEVNRLGKQGDDFLRGLRGHVGYEGEAASGAPNLVRLINAKAAEIEEQIGHVDAHRLANRPWPT